MLFRVSFYVVLRVQCTTPTYHTNNTLSIYPIPCLKTCRPRSPSPHLLKGFLFSDAHSSRHGLCYPQVLQRPRASLRPHSSHNGVRLRGCRRDVQRNYTATRGRREARRYPNDQGRYENNCSPLPYTLLNQRCIRSVF